METANVNTNKRPINDVCLMCYITKKPVHVVRSPATLSKVLTVDLILQLRLSDIFDFRYNSASFNINCNSNNKCTLM